MTRWLGRRPILYCVTDRRRLADSSLPGLLRHISAVLRAGVDAIQIRETDLTDRELTDLVRSAVQAAAGRGVPVLVNDRLDIALAAGAAGVHLKERSIRPDRARAIAPADFAIGCSVHSAGEAEAVAATGACDYLLFGTVYPTASKSTQEPAGQMALADVCRRVALPVLAIGGVDESKSAEIAAAGAAGLAAVGAFMAPDQARLDARARAMIHDFHDGTRSQISAD